MAYLLIAALFSAPLALAGGECPSLAEVSGKIEYCSRNDIALNQAKACSAKIHSDWVKKSAEVTKAMNDLRAKMKGQQENTLATSRSAYQKTVQELYSQILDMQKNTALVASYAQAMLNFAEEANEDEPDATCYTENFDKLQPIVSGLDKEIVQAKAVYDETVRLAKSTNVSTVGLGKDSAPGASSPNFHSKPVAPASPSVKAPKNRDSDVTGLKEDAEKRAKEKK